MKKSFRFDKEKLDYTLKFKRRRWWWLLLLLLPLLLLIRLEKTIIVKVTNTDPGSSAIVDAVVNFSYIRGYLYNKGYFLTKDNVEEKQKTDTSGTTQFVKVGYSVYSYIFQHNSPAVFFASDNCYASDTVKEKFHSISSGQVITLHAKPTVLAMDFLVVDKDDNMPLPGAQVSIRSAFTGRGKTEHALTGSAGTVVFLNVAKCGHDNTIIATADGYYPDSIVKKGSDYLLSGNIDSTRILRLKPIRKPIVFYVEDCTTRVGLEGADVTIDFKFDNTGKSEMSAQVTTNIYGVGKGIYNDAKLIASIHLKGSKSGYKEGNLPDWHAVKNFTDTNLYKKPQRTFCLQPEPNPLVFKDVNNCNNAPLAGVKNYIAIQHGDNRVDTVMRVSDANGNFQVTINTGDKISIIAKHPPGYEDNSDAVKNADGINLKNGPTEKRVIRLKPIMTELVFRTVDSDNNSLVPDANLVITGECLGSPVPVKSGPGGEFTVKAPLMSTISIAASKPGYGSNADKINHKSVQYLMKSGREERDIPLKKEPPPPPPAPPCSEPPQIAKKGKGTFVRPYNMFNPSASFDIVYDMHERYPDEMIVYCGQNDKGSIIGSTSGAVLQTGRITIDLKGCNSTWITVKVISADDDNTEWSYYFECH